MKHFNQDLYNKAINEFNEVVSRILPLLKDELSKLSIPFTDDIWQAFVKQGSSGKIKEIALENLNANKSLYAATPNQAPVSRVLTQIQNQRVIMGESYGRSSKSCYLIPLGAWNIDGTITPSSLENLKAHCTCEIDDKLFKTLEIYVKAHNSLNALIPGGLAIEGRYLTQDSDGLASINYYNF